MNKVDELICKYSNMEISVGELQGEMLLRDLGYDSLAKTELILALEEAYEIEFTIEDLNPRSFISVGSLREMMKRVI